MLQVVDRPLGGNRLRVGPAVHPLGVVVAADRRGDGVGDRPGDVAVAQGTGARRARVVGHDARDAGVVGDDRDRLLHRRRPRVDRAGQDDMTRPRPPAPARHEAQDGDHPERGAETAHRPCRS